MWPFSKKINWDDYYEERGLDYIDYKVLGPEDEEKMAFLLGKPAPPPAKPVYKLFTCRTCSGKGFIREEIMINRWTPFRNNIVGTTGKYETRTCNRCGGKKKVKVKIGWTH